MQTIPQYFASSNVQDIIVAIQQCITAWLAWDCISFFPANTFPFAWIFVHEASLLYSRIARWVFCRPHI